METSIHEITATFDSNFSYNHSYSTAPFDTSAAEPIGFMYAMEVVRDAIGGKCPPTVVDNILDFCGKRKMELFIWYTNWNIILLKWPHHNKSKKIEIINNVLPQIISDNKLKQHTHIKMLKAMVTCFERMVGDLEEINMSPAKLTLSLNLVKLTLGQRLAKNKALRSV